jgi:membrane fusion protein (multidrug efflux system)
MQQVNNNQTHKLVSLLTRNQFLFIWGLIVAIALYACNSSAGAPGMQQGPPALPVVTLQQSSATTYQEFTASLEGSQDIEIRPQVDGYLDKILVDEGAYVKKGQALFQINTRPYQEQLNTARASLANAKANLANAEINVSKLAPLVQNNIVSDVQLKTAKAAYDAAAAQVAQAEAVVQSANINLGYTTIHAPVEGYVGRIPFRTGSLVGVSTLNALTVVSSVRDIYAYFSFSEKDFLSFTQQFPGKTVEDKIKQLPAVELVMADEGIYPLKGKVETVSGQFNNTSGTISFRAVFQNTDGLLRSGNTGRIRIPHAMNTALAVPQETTFEMQDKVFVFTVADSNKVLSVPLQISGKSGNYYLVENGLKAGQRIVYAGFDRLKDGAIIQPQMLSLDSIIKARPL